MNEVFLIGKIISNIDFKFIVESKNSAVSIFNIKTLDNQIVCIKAYNSLADFAYSKLKENDLVFVYGSLEENVIFAKEIKKMCLKT